MFAVSQNAASFIETALPPQSYSRHMRATSIMEEVDFVEDMDSDDLWLKSHIEDIVDRYAHKVIAILDQQIVGVGTSIAELQQTVATHYPQRVPLIFEVPTREEFECLL
jgi:ABC-type phosphate/phosphonate transport system ATPase subunit